MPSLFALAVLTFEQVKAIGQESVSVFVGQWVHCEFNGHDLSQPQQQEDPRLMMSQARMFVLPRK